MNDGIFGTLMNLLPTVGFLYHFCSHAHAFVKKTGWLRQCGSDN